MYTIFNELSSLHVDNFDKEKARNIINDFVELLHKMNGKEDFRGLITTQDFFDFTISNYSISEWLSDPIVKKSHKIFLRTFFNKCRTIESNDYSLKEFEMTYNSQSINGIGCLVATEFKENTISLKTSLVWNAEEINGKVLTYEEGCILDEFVTINNLSETNHFDDLEARIFEIEFSMISSGQDLWEKRESLFPNLIFCESIKDQLYKDPEKFHIEQVAKKLLRLQEYFSSYNGIYSPTELGMKARTESETVKNNRFLKGLRYFKKPDGIADYFYDHIGFTGKYCGRIHFLPDDSLKKCYIGYIGVHLPTKNH